jgi:hypothetical protein
VQKSEVLTLDAERVLLGNKRFRWGKQHAYSTATFKHFHQIGGIKINQISAFSVKQELNFPNCSFLRYRYCLTVAVCTYRLANVKL